ncbi:hypothetical protein AYR66_01815 [Noviherbaspirillum denitrificans]|uniref:Uncharacterized protein n=1 Tax=Noviherbaspirillum denitrificans TaxID=1968433 RepID=A0A254T687_9BURK|nr:hypothetical protein AYR66_01815 [Noviherbaspirillum denitrificans]
MCNDADDSPDASGTDFVARLTEVPADFPRSVVHGAVAGETAKVRLVEYAGRYYEEGCTPPEIVTRWDGCEDLARQIAEKALASKHGKRKEMTEVAILEQYLPRLIATGWVSEAEARWVIRRVAAILNWPRPPTAEA